ncbi:hypothetical protein BG011_006406 [Mortierella polycephala]|uniref:Uncharacterized protein n=1 Tax=Mortierella polycephala TaxID=41804 RepID=A0A9P6U025_9FUNG|nr:hypothetical protein BG011_006406 [Mortierella polycephala]
MWFVVIWSTNSDYYLQPVDKDGNTLGYKIQDHTQKPKVVPTAVLIAIALWDKDKVKSELVDASEPPPGQKNKPEVASNLAFFQIMCVCLKFRWLNRRNFHLR